MGYVCTKRRHRNTSWMNVRGGNRKTERSLGRTVSYWKAVDEMVDSEKKRSDHHCDHYRYN